MVVGCLGHAIFAMTCGNQRVMNQRVALTEMQMETRSGIVRSVYILTTTTITKYAYDSVLCFGYLRENHQNYLYSLFLIKGFCCWCTEQDKWRGSFSDTTPFSRAGLTCKLFAKAQAAAHCMKYDDLWYVQHQSLSTCMNNELNVTKNRQQEMHPEFHMGKLKHLCSDWLEQGLHGLIANSKQLSWPL